MHISFGKLLAFLFQGLPLPYNHTYSASSGTSEVVAPFWPLQLENDVVYIKNKVRGM